MAKPKTTTIAKSTGTMFSGERVVYLILFALAFLLYANTIGHSYALDDRAVTFQNKFVQQGIGGFPEIMSTFYWNGFWEANAGLYRPMSLLVFAVEWQVAPNAPKFYHFIQVVMYALTCVLLYRLLRRLLKDYSKMLVLIATALFIVLPVHTEVVANIKSLDEILSLLFFILTMWQLLNYSDKKKPLSLVWAALLFYCALLSKEGAVLYFPMFALALFYFTKNTLRQIAITMTPLAVIGLLWFLQHSYVIAHAPTQADAYSYQDNALIAISKEFSMDRLATATGIFGNYLYKLIIPYPLSYDYSYNEFPGTSFANPAVLLTLAAVIGLLFIAFRQLKKKTLLSFSILWFFITFLLTCNLFVLIGSTMADRFLFIPSLGFCLAVGWLVSRLTGHVDSRIAAMSNSGILITGVAVIAFSVITFNRNKDWESDDTLFAADVEHAPESSRVHYNYGTALMGYGTSEINEGKKKEWYAMAEKEFLEALKLDTGFGTWSVCENLGVIYNHTKRYPESIAMTRLAIKKNPYDRTAPSNLGDSFLRLKQYDSTIVYLEKAISGNYIVKDTWLLLGFAYLNKKDTAKATSAFRQGSESFPDNLAMLENYGNILGMSKQYQQSIEVMEKLYALNPSNPEPLRIIAVNYEAMGNKTKTQDYLQRFLNAGGKLPGR